MILEIPAPQFGHPIELAILQRLQNEGEELMERYLIKNTREGAVYIARDAAKRLFPEYMRDRTNHNRFADRAASALAEAVRKRLLESPPVGTRREVALVTGCPASGKTVATARLRKNSLEIVHETILTDLAKSVRRVDETIHADRLPQLILIYTSDPRINVRRMVERALHIGRTVPLRYMAETYLGVPKMVSALHEHFGSALRLTLLNNSGTTDQVESHQNMQQIVKDMGRYTEVGVLEVMVDELNQINQENAIPSDIRKEAMVGISA